MGAFGLAWVGELVLFWVGCAELIGYVAILIAFRAYRQPGGSSAGAVTAGVVTPSPKGAERDTARNRVANSKAHRNGPYYGHGDARYVVEEWYY